MRSLNRVFHDVRFALPLLVLAELPAGALEITHQWRPPQVLPATPSAEQAAPHPLAVVRRLELTLFDNFGLKSRTAERIRREVENIFATMDTDIEWLDPLSEAPATKVPIGLRVVLIPYPPRIWGLSSMTMGVVFKTDGFVENVYIFPPAVMRTLYRLPEEIGANHLLMMNRLLARALGRVIGHEIIHAVAPDHPHTPNGLMQARLSRFSLGGEELAVESRCARVFLAHLQSRLQTADTARLRRGPLEAPRAPSGEAGPSAGGPFQ